MKYKLNVKLTLSYLFIAFLLVGIVAIVTNITFEKEFRKYVIHIQQEKNLRMVNTITKDYKSSGWDNEKLEEIGIEGLEDGLIIKVMDTNGTVLWDAMEHNSGICAEMLAEMAHNMKEYYPNFDGKYTSIEYGLKVDNKSIGKVLIGYYGPYYFSENDIAFLEAFNDVLVVIAIISILISICLGIFVSRRMSNSITNVIKTTKQIASGNYKHRVYEKSDTKEIIDLMDSVNNLATTLDRQEQLRKDLTSDIAHELRTPIATLQSHLEAVKDGVWELNKDRIDSLYEEIIRISKIVNDLDRLNDYDGDKIVLDKTEFRIKRIISKVVDNFDAEAKDKNISIAIDGEDQQITADKDKITQVFINLISNSLKYTNENGHIDIAIEKMYKKVKITIRDNGIGISENDLPYIFKRFYRADKSRTRATGGSGIGLSIVKNIIEAHNGSVSAESKIDKGTSITIVLPR